MQPETSRSSVDDGTVETRPLGRVLCGVDFSRAGHEAARQAAVLVGGVDRLALASVAWKSGSGKAARATLDPGLAVAALDDLARDMEAGGIRPQTILIEGADDGEALVDAAREFDLLVIGGRGQTRAGGVLSGSATSTALHRCSVPVLVARDPMPGITFPSPVVLAGDGSECSGRAARLAGRLARLHGSPVTHLHAAGRSDVVEQQEIAREIADLGAEAGADAHVAVTHGAASGAIVDYVREHPAGLLVLGSRGLGGVRSLGSVSERVAHHAPCSVLVVRGTGG